MNKSHVKGYARKDGVYVAPHQRDVKHGPHVVVPHHHPKKNEQGKPVTISHPSVPSSHTTWHNHNAVATFTPDGDTPLSLNGVNLHPWEDYPKTAEGWDFVDGVDDDLAEPPFNLPNGKVAASGVVIEEPDGRVWLIAPTNQFGGYDASLPKGTAEVGLSLQANAIKEAFEESGLQVEITGFVGDFERTTSYARIYTARRVGGTPSDMGWESQAVHLVPKGLLYDHLNMYTDHPIAEAVGAGAAPLPPPKQKKQNNLF